jgi:hypothetical protein
MQVIASDFIDYTRIRREKPGESIQMLTVLVMWPDIQFRNNSSQNVEYPMNSRENWSFNMIHSLREGILITVKIYEIPTDFDAPP